MEIQNNTNDISKIVNKIVIITLLILIVVVTFLYILFGVNGLLKAPEEVIVDTQPPVLSEEERKTVLNNLETLENPVEEKEAFKYLKALSSSSTPNISGDDREKILKSL